MRRNQQMRRGEEQRRMVDEDEDEASLNTASRAAQNHST